MVNDEVLRRICLAYPWSAECRAIAPIVPSADENAAIWHGPGGYVHAVGKEIPPGARCESVQLVPVESIMKPRVDPSVLAVPPSPALGMYTQIPPPMAQSMGIMSVQFLVSATTKLGSIKNFL